MDRIQLKERSKNLIRTAQPKPVVTAIIYLLIIAALSFLSYKLVGGAAEEIRNVYDSFGFNYNVDIYDSTIDPEQFAYALEQALPSPLATLLYIAIEIVTIVLGAGFAVFCLRTVRGMEASYWNIFDAFEMFFRVIWLYILEGIFIFLWSLLFIVPGFIAFYRYRMALYLLLEHPEMSALQCISESKRIMVGHKGELFGVDLSFIGWALLVGIVSYIGDEIAIGLGSTIAAQILSAVELGTLVEFFVFPYMQLTYAGYYVELTRPAPETAFEDGWVPPV